MQTNLSREQTEDGVAVLTFDRPGSTANLFDDATFDELVRHLDEIAATAGLRGLVLRSAKPRIFIAGADLSAFNRPADEVAALVTRGQATFDRIANLSIPSVALIHGVALGGGLEIALACDYRVASLDPATTLGLPEVTLGILPAWGGSTRLPRLVGLRTALEAILTGKSYPAKAALKIGLVDALAYPADLQREGVKLLARGKRKTVKPFLANRPPIAGVIVREARKRALVKTRGNYPAPLRALDVVAAGLAVPPATSFENERRAFVELAQGEPASNLIRVFFLRERAKKLSVEGADGAAPPRVQSALVVGAGLMGAGIAQWLSSRGLRVTLQDVGPEPLGRGLQKIAKLYRDAVRRKVFTEAEARAGFDRIVPVYADVPLRKVDLVLEAAVENLETKRQLFAALERRAPDCGILATNTSALSIDAIADGLTHPERVVGVHFFNPVHRMQLVEIVRGPRTAPETVVAALALVKAIGKLPVLVNDSPGFLVNRVLLPYLVEAVRAFRDGYAPERIDRVMLDFGMPMGPLRLLDEVGLDVAAHVADDLARRLPHLAPLDDTVRRLIEAGALGCKTGRGFYDHASPAKETVNGELSKFPRTGTPPGDDADLRDRLVLVMVNEGARLLEEGVVAAPEDVDFGMIMGTGWAPFRGGPLRHADAVGLARVCERLEELARRFGGHLAPCGLLVATAARNGRLSEAAPGAEPFRGAGSPS